MDLGAGLEISSDIGVEPMAGSKGRHTVGIRTGGFFWLRLTEKLGA